MKYLCALYNSKHALLGFLALHTFVTGYKKKLYRNERHREFWYHLALSCCYIAGTLKENHSRIIPILLPFAGNESASLINRPSASTQDGEWIKCSQSLPAATWYPQDPPCLLVWHQVWPSEKRARRWQILLSTVLLRRWS